MMTQTTSFGYVPTPHTMTSSPRHNFHGYMGYPWMQGYAGHNYINQHITGQNDVNKVPMNCHTFNENSIFNNNASSSFNTALPTSAMSSAQYRRTLLQHNSPNMNRQYQQHSGYMYTST